MSRPWKPHAGRRADRSEFAGPGAAASGMVRLGVFRSGMGDAQGRNPPPGLAPARVSATGDAPRRRCSRRGCDVHNPMRRRAMRSVRAAIGNDGIIRISGIFTHAQAAFDRAPRATASGHVSCCHAAPSLMGPSVRVPGALRSTPCPPRRSAHCTLDSTYADVAWQAGFAGLSHGGTDAPALPLRTRLRRRGAHRSDGIGPVRMG